MSRIVVDTLIPLLILDSCYNEIIDTRKLFFVRNKRTMNSFNVLFIFELLLCLGARTLNAQTVTIPDANFKTYLVGNAAINTNGDAHIQVSEAVAFAGTINCSSQNISNLTGIQAFTSLARLDCYNNQLTELDVSYNTALTTLYCHNNQLSSLNLKNGNNANMGNAYFSATGNPNLACIEVDDSLYSTNNWTNIDSGTRFDTDCNISNAPIVTIPDANFKAYLLANGLINTNGDNEIQVIEASSFTGTIQCGNKNISDLRGIEAFTNVTYLYCQENQLKNLDVSHNLALRSLSCSSNQLTKLDLQHNVNLWYVYCDWNALRSLDISQNVNLISFSCMFNQLVSVKAKTGTGSSSSIHFKSLNNPDLYCIEVDDPSYCTVQWVNFVDPIVTFSTNCSVTNVHTISNDIQLSVFPNPTSGDITLELGKSYDEVNIQVRSITGQQIFSKTLENVASTVVELGAAAGIYLVTVQTAVGQRTLKVVKE